jgi:predicted ATPase/DNA-binding NarL/FixJ family response regulator
MPSGNAGLHNVPTHLTRFFGRDAAVEEIRRLISGARLVTLTGAGGSGKTRLACHVIEGLVDDFPDGIWFVELSGLVEGDPVEQGVADLMDIPQQPGPLLATLTGFLHDSRCLLVLDNCEHLAGSCAALAERLLQTCPQVRILATSRERLRVPSEQAWRIPSLDVPGPGPVHAPEALAVVPSVSLFLDRARLADPSFEITDANAADVASICVRLDGIPLAIELAAARVELLTPREIYRRLGNSLELLGLGDRTSPARHQTIRAAIDSSYELLEPDERAMLARLSVFVGGFRLEAAETMWATAGHTTSALDVVARLVERSMLQSRPKRERYEMLEPIRQYGRERLEAAGELDEACSRHLEHCLLLGREAEPQMRSMDCTRWLQRLEEEHGNIRAALDWGLGRDPDRALELAIAVGGLWYLRGHMAEGCARLRRGLARAVDVVTRLRALNLLGWLALRAGDLEAAEEALEDCLDLGARRGIGDLAAEVRNNLGLLWCWKGDLEAARRDFERGLALSEELGDEHSLALAMFNLCLIDFLTGGGRTPPSMLHDCLAILERLGDQPGIAFARGLLGCVALESRDVAGATVLLQAALRITRDVGDKVNVLFGLDAFAFLAVKTREYRHALLLAGAAAAVRDAVGTITFPQWQSRIDEAVDLAGRVLGPEAAAAAYAEGRRLSLAEAIDLALAGPPPRAQPSAEPDVGGLSRRELEVALLVATGLTNRAIAKRLGIAERTIETHVANAMNKLGFNNRSELTAWVVQRRLRAAG